MKKTIFLSTKRHTKKSGSVLALSALLIGSMNSCSQGGFSAKHNPLPAIEVTSAVITNSELQLIGKSLDSVTSLSLKQGTTSLPLAITAKSSKTLLASFLSGTITALTSFDFIMTSANAGVSQSAILTINLSGSSVTNFTSTGITDSATSSLVKLSSGGLVGIGTTSPSALLTVNSNTGTLPSVPTGTLVHVTPVDATAGKITVESFGAQPSYVLRRSSGTSALPTALANNDVFGEIGAMGYGATGYSATNRASVKFNAGELWTDAAQGSFITFHTTPVTTIIPEEQMRITNAGLVGIGVTPTVALHVVGDAAGNTMILTDGNANSCTFNPTAAAVTSCTSDVRLKTNIQSVDDGEMLSKLLRLNTVTFHWKKSPAAAHTGLIAQEVEKIFPEFVIEGIDGYKQLGTSGLVPVLVSAIKQLYHNFTADLKEQRIEIIELKSENLALKKRLDALEKISAKNTSK